MSVDHNSLVRKAIEEFAIDTAVPLIEFNSDDLDAPLNRHLGTATLFSHQDRLFLVTAKHVLEECNQANLAVPQAPKGSTLTTLGSTDLLVPTYDFLDVGVLEILDGPLRRLLSEHWTIVSANDVADFDHTQTHFFLGYPRANVGRSATGYRARPLPVFMASFDAKPANATPPVYKNVDMFFDDPTMQDDFPYQRPDELQGVSGSAIWAVSEVPEGSLWTPRKALKIVGLQCSVWNGDYIRGKQFKWIQGILDRC